VIVPAALAIIASTPGVVRTLPDGLPDAVVLKPNDGGWSLKDLVAHLHNVEGVAFVERVTWPYLRQAALMTQTHWRR
jgi:hypothetical protein